VKETEEKKKQKGERMETEVAQGGDYQVIGVRANYKRKPTTNLTQQLGS